MSMIIDEVRKKMEKGMKRKKVDKKRNLMAERIRMYVLLTPDMVEKC